MNKTVYFLIDCSGSMHGSRGDAVNAAMEKVVKDVVPQIKDQKSADLDISFKVIGFRGEREIRTLADADLEDFQAWKPLTGESFQGQTPTGAAIQEVINDIQGGAHGDVDKNVCLRRLFLFRMVSPMEEILAMKRSWSVPIGTVPRVSIISAGPFALQSG